MSTAVWTWDIGNNYEYIPEYDESIVDLGGGITKSAMHETPTSGYDGTGTSRSHYGTRIFKITIQRSGTLSESDIMEIFAFLQARKEAGNEAFYFYNPAENSTIDETGTVTTGRYKVKCLDKFGLAFQHIRSYGFGTLTFTEDRS